MTLDLGPLGAVLGGFLMLLPILGGAEAGIRWLRSVATEREDLQ